MFQGTLDFVSQDEEGHASPKAAVESVADAHTEIVGVDVHGRTASVVVRLGEDSGTFSVNERDSEWFVTGGEGCAAWAAAWEVVGEHECTMPLAPDEDSTEPKTVSVC